MDNMALRNTHIAVLEHPRLQIETKEALELVTSYSLSFLLTNEMQIIAKLMVAKIKPGKIQARMGSEPRTILV